jgi:hypothetical protein
MLSVWYEGLEPVISNMDVMPCGFCKDRRYGGTNGLHHQDEKSQRASNSDSINYQLKHTAKKH